jgi:hypothetical protein
LRREGGNKALLNMAGWLLLIAGLAAFAAGDFVEAGAFLISAAAIAIGLTEW